MKKSDSTGREKLLKSFLDQRVRLCDDARARIPLWLRGEVDAEDIVQEVCTRVLDASSGFTDLGGSARLSWLKHMTRNVMIDALRRAATRVQRGNHSTAQGGSDESAERGDPSQLRAPGQTPSGELQSTETCEMVGEALHSLGVRASRIIRMYYIESLPINHIAANFEVAPSTIRRVLQRSVRTMELSLGDGRKFSADW